MESRSTLDPIKKEDTQDTPVAKKEKNKVVIRKVEPKKQQIASPYSNHFFMYSQVHNKDASVEKKAKKRVKNYISNQDP